MVGKNNTKLIREKMNNHFTRWSIRKLTTGAALVAVSCGLFIAGSQTAKAADVDQTAEAQTEIANVSKPKEEENIATVDAKVKPGINASTSPSEAVDKKENQETLNTSNSTVSVNDLSFNITNHNDSDKPAHYGDTIELNLDGPEKTVLPKGSLIKWQDKWGQQIGWNVPIKYLTDVSKANLTINSDGNSFTLQGRNTKKNLSIREGQKFSAVLIIGGKEIGHASFKIHLDTTDYTIKTKDLIVGLNTIVDPFSAIENLSEMDQNATYKWQEKVDTSTPGDKGYSYLVVTYPDGSTNVVSVRVTVNDTVGENKKDADIYSPITKELKFKLNDKTSIAKNAILNSQYMPKSTSYEWETKIDTSSEGKKQGSIKVTYPDKSWEIIPVVAYVGEKPEKIQASQYNPTGQDIKIKKGKKLDLIKGISNISDLPKDVALSLKDPIDESAVGNIQVTIVVRYSDGSIDEVPITVNVSESETQSSKYNPKVKTLYLGFNENVKAEMAVVNKDDLPEGTTYNWENKIDTTKSGFKEGVILVKYPDGSSEKVNVFINVARPVEQASKYNPVGQDLQIKKGEEINIKKAITNILSLPGGTYLYVKDPIDDSVVGDIPVTIVVRYADGSIDEVQITVNVSEPDTLATKYNPIGQDLQIKKGEEINIKNAITNILTLPGGTYLYVKDPIDDSIVGDIPVTIVVRYADGSIDEVPITVNVSEPDIQASKYNPVGQDLKIKKGEGINIKNAITNILTLPGGTYLYVKDPIDESVTGDIPVTIVVRYADGSIDEVPITVNVSEPDTLASKYNPIGQDLKIKKGEKINIKNAITNILTLPGGTYLYVKDPIDESVVGDIPVTIVVRYADGSIDEVPITVNVSEPDTQASKYNPVGQDLKIKKGEEINIKNAITNILTLPGGTYLYVKDPIDESVTGDIPVTIVVRYADGSIDEVPIIVNVSLEKAPTLPYLTDLDASVHEEGQIIITGKGNPGHKVKITDQDNRVLGEGVVDEFGNLVISITPNDHGGVSLLDALRLTVSDEDGNNPQDLFVHIQYDGDQPNILNAKAVKNSDGSITVSGNGDPTNGIEIFDSNKNFFGTVSVSEEGTFEHTLLPEISALRFKSQDVNIGDKLIFVPFNNIGLRGQPVDVILEKASSSTNGETTDNHNGNSGDNHSESTKPENETEKPETDTKPTESGSKLPVANETVSINKTPTVHSTQLSKNTSTSTKLNVAKKANKTLPQTGSTKNTTATIIGSIMVGIAGLIMLVGASKKNRFNN